MNNPHTLNEWRKVFHVSNQILKAFISNNKLRTTKGKPLIYSDNNLDKCKAIITKYLADLLRQYNGDVKLALAGYNAGPGNVEKHNGIPPFTETKNYISRVLGYLKYFNG